VKLSEERREDYKELKFNFSEELAREI